MGMLEPSQDRKIAALTVIILMCIFFWSDFMNYDEYYMKKALIQAKKAYCCNEVPVGAILVKDGKVIASAYNHKDYKNCVLEHAELICIRKASKKLKNWRLNDCTLYVTLEPCPMCASAIQQARISTIVYGASSNNIVNHQIVNKIFHEKGSNMNVNIRTNVCILECSSLISEFFQEKRR